MGQGLEALTHGVTASTTHRVLAPSRGQGSRFSIPFFQGVSYDTKFESVDIPESIRREKEAFIEKSGGQRMDDVEFTFVKGKFRSHGEATFFNRCKSHEDVAQRWYPDIWEKIQAEKQADAAKLVSSASQSPLDTQGLASNSQLSSTIAAH